MFARVFALAAAASLFTFAAAAPGAQAAAQCNTGTIQCCNSAQDVKTLSHEHSLAYQLIGIDVGSITGMIGANCSPLSVIGLAGNSCSSQPVCCSDNKFNGLIAVGCTPININA
ncbi:hypothetical protein NMY22_g4154 [Coprinellus aureogranulatus]|nr:hypothetical protein NMY22_g12500 [Coprinellus aureogranulatus]KAJ3540796.1 hypothetical protein NMY22_g4154 [Coprinellus aureogranulatus]